MSLGMMDKSPDDVLDYDVNFDRWLPEGDRITAVTTSIEGSTAVIGSSEFSDTSVKVWISGGVLGESATVTVEITTLNGRTKETCFRLRIRDCN